MDIINFLPSDDKSDGLPAQVKYSQMIKEDIYWKIVEQSLVHSNNQHEQEQFLISALQRYTDTDIIGFHLRTYKLLYDTYSQQMWCAAYIVNGGSCSDDGFQYFRCWLISRGQDTYYQARNNPDSLVGEINPARTEYDFETFWYVASYAFTAKTGKSIHLYIDDAFGFYEYNYPRLEFTCNDADPRTLSAVCPRLFRAIWTFDNE